jgi:tryptophan synthase alpha subunit
MYRLVFPVNTTSASSGNVLASTVPLMLTAAIMHAANSTAIKVKIFLMLFYNLISITQVQTFTLQRYEDFF